MRAILTILLASGAAWGQAAQAAKPVDAVTSPNAPQRIGDVQGKDASALPAAQDAHSVVIPSGSKIPLTLKQAIETTSDSLELAQEDLASRSSDVLKKAEREQKEIESVMQPKDLEEKKAEEKKAETAQKNQKKPPTLLRKGEAVKKE